MQVWASLASDTSLRTPAYWKKAWCAGLLARLPSNQIRAVAVHPGRRADVRARKRSAIGEGSRQLQSRAAKLTSPDLARITVEHIACRAQNAAALIEGDPVAVVCQRRVLQLRALWALRRLAERNSVHEEIAFIACHPYEVGPIARLAGHVTLHARREVVASLAIQRPNRRYGIAWLSHALRKLTGNGAICTAFEHGDRAKHRPAPSAADSTVLLKGHIEAVVRKLRLQSQVSARFPLARRQGSVELTSGFAPEEFGLDFRCILEAHGCAPSFAGTASRQIAAVVLDADGTGLVVLAWKWLTRREAATERSTVACEKS